MKTINYAEELKVYCEHDSEGYGERTATFLRVEDMAEEGLDWIYYCKDCGHEERVTHEREKDYIYIGSCPLDENPFPMYSTLTACRAYLKQLTNLFSIPEGGKLRIKAEIGGGGYYEVVADYDPSFPKSIAWALYLEGNCPERWSKAALKTLKEVSNEY